MPKFDTYGFSAIFLHSLESIKDFSSSFLIVYAIDIFSTGAFPDGVRQ
jgi:hypothetical protein